MKIKLTHGADSSAEIVVTIDEAAFKKHHEGGMKKIREVAEVDGFRKGHVPDNIIMSKYGEMAVYEEMADMAIQSTFADAIKEAKIDAIGRPDIMVTKLAIGNDFEYRIKVAIMPTLELPDYIKVAKSVKIEDAVVTEKDIDEVMLELRRMRAHKELHSDGSEHDNADEDHNKAHSQVDKIEEGDLPELTDEYVTSLGDFKTVSELRAKVTENLQLEKDQKTKEKRRNALLEKIAESSMGVLPEVLIESESDRMLAQMKGDVAQMGGKFEDYLTYIKKTESDLRTEWKPDAEKRAKIQIILNQIAKEKNIEPDDNVLKLETKRLMDTYSDAEEIRAREYMHQMLLNEEVLKVLEA